MMVNIRGRRRNATPHNIMQEDSSAGKVYNTIFLFQYIPAIIIIYSIQYRHTHTHTKRGHQYILGNRTENILSGCMSINLK